MRSTSSGRVTWSRSTCRSRRARGRGACGRGRGARVRLRVARRHRHDERRERCRRQRRWRGRRSSVGSPNCSVSVRDVTSTTSCCGGARRSAAIARTGLGFTASRSTNRSGSRRCCTSPPTCAPQSTKSVPASEWAGEWMKSIGKGVPGYVTPKLAVGCVVGNDKGEILLVQRADSGVWLYPTGWADVGYSPAEVVVKEVHEETGIDVEPDAHHRRDRRRAESVHTRAAVLAGVPLPRARRRADAASARDTRRRVVLPRRASRNRSSASTGGAVGVRRDRRRTRRRQLRRAAHAGRGAAATSTLVRQLAEERGDDARSRRVTFPTPSATTS